MSKTIVIDVYRVNLPENSGTTFEAILKSVIAESDLRARNWSRFDDSNPIRLQDCTPWGESFEGDMVKIKMDNIPPKASLAGSVSSLDLGDEDGLGAEVAFVYFPPLKTLLIQRNRMSVSSKAFAEYFQARSDFNGPIFLEPVIKLDILVKLDRLDKVTKFQISVAGLSNPQLFRQQGHSLEQLIDLQEKFRSPFLHVSFSLGQGGKGSLRVPEVKSTVRRLMRIASNEEENQVHKIEVNGSRHDTGIEVLDLLNARLAIPKEVEVDADRRLPYANRRRALRSAFHDILPELRARYSGTEAEG